ncbi:Septum site-determining protein MinD [Planctomycetes bacterium Poly30]|uniref:Iron-sulfur cluster carrier protein n=1 Tax=Saltatorellus ferox TaxID=2528018 RepID=A0A518EQ17_9BACT|nr:Septum site-determining protein MinD [Planctomycetes bacterium Poly30]
MNVTAPTRDAVLDALRGVIDPDLSQDIVSLGFVTRCEVTDAGAVDVVINLTTPACPVKDLMRDQARGFIEALPGVTSVEIEMTAEVKGPSGPARDAAKGVKHIVAVSSGKGGVGKSTVAVNLACALAQTGARVGLLDCDVHGPDVPMMMGLAGNPEQIEVDGKTKLVPKERRGVKTMSIGYLVPDEQPVIWRGPMVHSFIRQMLTDVLWGELDYLLVDMPPGTGDAQLSLAQEVPLSGAVLVTTPQAVAAFDVTKAISMFRQVDVPILGIIENMSGLVLKGKVEGGEAGSEVSIELGSETQNVVLEANGVFHATFEVFGSGGAEALGQKHGFPVLGKVPVDPGVRAGGDGGEPIVSVEKEGRSVAADALRAAAGRLAQRLAVKAFSSLPILD